MNNLMSQYIILRQLATHHGILEARNRDLRCEEMHIPAKFVKIHKYIQKKTLVID